MGFFDHAFGKINANIFVINPTITGVARLRSIGKVPGLQVHRAFRRKFRHCAIVARREQCCAPFGGCRLQCGVVVDIKRAKNDSALACSATCFLGQCRNRIGEVMPTSNAAFVSQTDSERTHIAVYVSLLRQFQQPDNAAHGLGELRLNPAFGAGGDVTQGVAFKSSHSLNRREYGLKKRPALGQCAEKFTLPENCGLALSIGCEREFAIFCHTYVLCLLSQMCRQMSFGRGQ